ncbi:MAG: redox-sensing transcriptional repressor Rex [Planctomycetota bacterium]
MKDESSRAAIPRPTVSRLPYYRRALEFFLSMGQSVVSSHELARESDVSPSQLRKDLAYFGQFGTAGIGYDVRDLLSRLDDILGMTHRKPVILVGVGNLGRAVLNHLPAYRSGFEVVGSVDISPAKVGRVIGGVRCHDFSEIPAIVKENGVTIAILTCSPEHAQEAAEVLQKSGIRAIVNFTPVRLRVPETVLVEQVDFGFTLQKVSFYLEPTEDHR